MCRLSPKRFPKIWAEISYFFKQGDGVIWQQRLLSDYQNVLQKILTNRHNGSLGGRAKSLKDKERALANGINSPPLNHSERGSIPDTDTDIDIKELSMDSYKNPPKKPKGNGNGHRIEAEFGEDWNLPEKYHAYAVSKGLDERETGIEFEKFVNYWKAKPGNQTTKRNWLATWRSWILNSAEWKRSNGGYRNGQSRGGGTPLVDIATELIDELGDGIP